MIWATSLSTAGPTIFTSATAIIIHDILPGHRFLVLSNKYKISFMYLVHCEIAQSFTWADIHITILVDPLHLVEGQILVLPRQS